MNLIQLGSTDPDVLTWQTEVLKLDLPDGIFGPATKAATIEWQKQHNIVPDGIVGPHSWDAAGYSAPIPVTHKDIYQTYVPQSGDPGYRAPVPESTGYGTRVAAPNAPVPRVPVPQAPAAPPPAKAGSWISAMNAPWWAKALALLGIGYGVYKASEKK